MTLLPPETILVVFLLFCRIGGCLMLMPGFSSSRVPVQVRLFVAVSVTLALTPLLLPTVNSAVPNLEPPTVDAPDRVRDLDRRADRSDRSPLLHGAAIHGERSGTAVRLQPGGRSADRGHRVAAAAGDLHHADGYRAAVRHRPALGSAARAAGVLFGVAHQRADGCSTWVLPGLPMPSPAPSFWRCRSAARSSSTRSSSI